MIEMCPDVQLSIGVSDSNNGVEVDKSNAGHEILNDDETIEAVSYTHLDVYKRQKLHTVFI